MSPSEPTRLSIVFPMWNEEAMVERAVASATESARAMVASGEIADYEIVIVDDGSTDATGALIDGLADRDPRVTVVHHDRNRSLGAALRSGFEAAGGTHVLYTGADLPFDLLETSKALRLIRAHDADLIAAYRLDRTGEGPRRYLYSLVYNALVRLVFGLRVRDVNFSAKLMRAEVLDAIDLQSEGSFVDVELLVKAQLAGYRTIQFGVDYFPRSRGVSTLSSWPVIARMLREMATIGVAMGSLRRRHRHTGPTPP